MDREETTPDDKPDIRDIEPGDLGRVNAYDVPEPEGDVVTGETDDDHRGGDHAGGHDAD